MLLALQAVVEPPQQAVHRVARFRPTAPDCGGMGGWRGSRFLPGFVYLSVCDRSDGQPTSRPFPTAFPRTVRATFEAHGSPVIRSQKFSMLACRLPYSLPPDQPVPLRHVAGFPGPRLLRGLRRRRARALEAILSFPVIVRPSLGEVVHSSRHPGSSPGISPYGFVEDKRRIFGTR